MSKSVNPSSFNKSEPTINPEWNYEATVAEVESIIEQIEAGELALADVFDRYTAAVKYLNECDAFLQQRQHQMDILIETLTESDF